METTRIVTILFIAALVLLLFVSGGILYLTTVQWRDRRRQDRDKKSSKSK